ncbi:MAG: FKBP-type peptidyl-prolyl cis-trans isomerase [Lachnospiraceae bacterium]|nr:FKBP-type peptidyl-prolyl cis-trans isomerase [Lachnospiraceae bacterium]
MKKKLAMMCVASVLLVGVSACGGHKSDEETQETIQASETSEGSTASEEEHADSEASTEFERVSDREDYIGLQDLDIDAYVSLADYKNMKVSVARPEVDDESILQYIDGKLLAGSITNRAVQEGDVADIDFVGKRDGVAFDGGSASGFKLTIGSGQFIPGFEDGLVGVMPGDTVDLNLTFPEGYQQSAELAGQEVVFTVTVNSIAFSAAYATVTPEELEALGLPYTSKEEVWEAGTKEVENYAEETFAANAKTAIVQKLVAESEVQSIPEYFVEEEAQNYNLYMETFIKAMFDMDVDTYIRMVYSITPDEFYRQMNEVHTETIRQYMVMEALARAEGIEVTEEMINEKADEEAAEYGYASGQELIDSVGFTTYRMSIVREKVIERLMEIVSVEEEETQEAES